MIDVIIPIYNSHNTICQTLSSIYLQTYKDRITVYLIDDGSEKDYENELNLYNDLLNIVYLKLPKNSGPGVARQYGIDNSKNEYIIFLDSDDQFYNSFSVEKLYKEIKDNDLDLVIGTEIVDENKEQNTMGSLHSKIYKRKNIKDKNIKFNNTYYSEDNSFNNLVFYTTDKHKKIDEPFYIYKNNKNSLTKKEKDKEKILINYIYNMIWLYLNLKKRNVDNIYKWNSLFGAYIYTFYETKDKNYTKIFSYCYRLEELFKEIEKEIKTENNINTKDLLLDYFEKQDTKNKESHTLLNEFESFRKKFIYRGLK